MIGMIAQGTLPCKGLPRLKKRVDSPFAQVINSGSCSSGTLS